MLVGILSFPEEENMRTATACSMHSPLGALAQNPTEQDDASHTTGATLEAWAKAVTTSTGCPPWQHTTFRPLGWMVAKETSGFGIGDERKYTLIRPRKPEAGERTVTK